MTEFAKAEADYMARKKPILLPCPFCGQPAQIVTNRDPCKVGCFNPQCGVKPKSSSTCESTAITHWNRRAIRIEEIKHLTGQLFHWRAACGADYRGQCTTDVPDHVTCFYCRVLLKSAKS